MSFVASNLTLESELPDVIRHGISDADEKAWLLRLARDSASILRELPQPPLVTALPFTVERVVTTPGRAADPRPLLVQAYEAAASSAPARCHLPVTLLAAIGQVESGSIGGRSLYGHRVVPAIYGPMLTGGAFAAIHDTDHGRLDGNSQWDRAVGPMQFIPGTWSRYGVDGDHDGIADPQNVFDATASAASYLCMGGRDLSRPGDLRAAVLSYNASSSYLATVLRWMAYFQSQGLGAISAVSFPVASGTGTALPSTTSPADPPPATRPRLPAPLGEESGTGSTTSPPVTTEPSPSPTTSGPDDDDLGPDHDDLGPDHDDLGPDHDDLGPDHDDLGPDHDDLGPDHDHLGPDHHHLGPDHDHLGPDHDHLGPDHDHHLADVSRVAHVIRHRLGHGD